MPEQVPNSDMCRKCRGIPPGKVEEGTQLADYDIPSWRTSIVAHANGRHVGRELGAPGKLNPRLNGRLIKLRVLKWAGSLRLPIGSSLLLHHRQAKAT